MKNHWTKFRDNHALSGLELSIPEESDLSGCGCEMEIFDDAGSISEAEEAYPGIVVAKDGYFPIGGCSLGTGDPFFVKLEEGEDGALYQIYHDEVSETGYVESEAVVKVLEKYRALLSFKEELS